MKKIIALITFIVFTACLLCSCAQPIADGYNQNGTTKKELRVKAKEFTALLESLNADEIDKVEIIFRGHSGLDNERFYTVGQTSITKWVKLLKKIEFTVVPYYVIVGGFSYQLNIYINGEKQLFGYIGDTGHIFFGDDKTMCQVDNFDELRGEFAKLEMDMGFNLHREYAQSTE